MKCPVDGAILAMTERSGVEIDYCPQCRGVWLDRGELDKILARAEAPLELSEPGHAPRELPRRDGGGSGREAVSPGNRQPPQASYGDDRRPSGDKLDEWRQERDEDGHRKKRSKGFLGELFDF